MHLSSLNAPETQIFLWLLAPLVIVAFGVSSYWVSTIIANQPYRRRAMVLHGTFIILESILPKIAGIETGISVLSMLLCSVLCARLAFDQRKFSLVVLSLKLVASWTVLEVICGCLMITLISLKLFTSEITIVRVEEFLKPDRILIMYGVATLAQCVLTAALLVFRRVAQFRKKDNRRWLYTKVIIRLIALILLGGSALYFIATVLVPKIRIEKFVELSTEYTMAFIIPAGLLLVAVSYLAQDIRYIDQLRRNETLERQRMISQSMLKNLRFFRHNMINMLYGLDGAILTGDTGDIRTYYREMERRCALVNNENIIALERMTIPALNAVLIRAIDQAREKELPFSLYVQEGLRPARSLSSGEMCQILGVLLDNALEAAGNSKEPFVLVEIRNVDGMQELIVKNTYSGTVDKAILRGGNSTKRGHAGVGITSCYDILKRKRNAFLNYDVSGQYVRAQLLIKI